MTEMTCCVCGSGMITRLAFWCFQCPECGTWSSTLPIGINQASVHGGLDEVLREEGLAALREENLGRVADRLVDVGLPPSARLLDVGSAHGWFLRAAELRGFTVVGIEPDTVIAGMPGTGPVRIGFFPDVLDTEERFDAITFNDVLEHLPDPGAALSASARHLAGGGLLSINIPNSEGLFFRLACLCRRMGIGSAFDRLWQRGLPSPHLWYFNRAGLIRLAERHGFEVVLSSTLDSVRRRHLWQRAHADRKPSFVSVLGVIGVYLLAPVLNRPAASDIMHLVFRAASRD